MAIPVDLPYIWRLARRNVMRRPERVNETKTDGLKMPAVGRSARDARFDLSFAKGVICVLGNVACRTCSSPHAIGLYGDFAAIFGRFYGHLHRVVVD